MSKNKNQHVVPRNGGWAVRGEGKSRDTAHTNTQHEAIERAREIARNQGSEVVIHGKDGKIQERNSYSYTQSAPAGLAIDSNPAKLPRKRSAKQSPSEEQTLQSMLDAYQKRAAETSPLEAFLGMFDDDITDLSSIKKEDVLEAYRKKYADSD